MIRLSINLPKGFRLDMNFVKGRKTSDNTPFIPNLGEVFRARKGSKFSRYFRHIFEHQKVKKVLGANLAMLIMASSFMPAAATFEAEPDLVIAQENTSFTTEKGIRYPIEEVAITQSYQFYHPGIDFDGLTGDAVYPIMAGVVDSIEYSRFAYGNAVIVNHGNGTTSLYAHLSSINVEEGQEIKLDTKIGEMGATGRAFGDHLHLEVYNHGRTINPFSVLPLKTE